MYVPAQCFEARPLVTVEVSALSLCARVVIICQTAANSLVVAVTEEWKLLVRVEYARREASISLIVHVANIKSGHLQSFVVVTGLPSQCEVDMVLHHTTTGGRPWHQLEVWDAVVLARRWMAQISVSGNRVMLETTQ
jgi:hypothetical protein